MRGFFTTTAVHRGPAHVEIPILPKTEFSVHNGGGFHFRTLAHARALPVATDGAVLRLGRAGAAAGVGEGRVSSVFSGAVRVFSRRRGSRLTSPRCRRWFPFPHACARARPPGCHGRSRVGVGSGGRSGGAGQKTRPLTGAVPVFSRRCCGAARLTSSRCRRWFPFPHACARARPLGSRLPWRGTEHWLV